MAYLVGGYRTQTSSSESAYVKIALKCIKIRPYSTDNNYRNPTPPTLLGLRLGFNIIKAGRCLKALNIKSAVSNKCISASQIMSFSCAALHCNQPVCTGDT